MRILLAWLVVSCGLALAPGRAEACHTGYQISRLVFGAGALLVDTPLVIHDLAVDRASRGYGVLEGLLTAPQIALALSLRAEGKEDCGDEASGTIEDQAGSSPVVPLMLVASTALFVHAIYVIVRPSGSSPPKSPPAVSLVPFVVTDRGEVAGATMSVAF